jgi:Zn-dependent peptidase ImmA (M78 family)/transcriptional regulator with XRE-family HTH domain
MSIDLATLGKRLRDARVNCGLTQEQAADKLGVPRTAIVHMEAGNRSISTLELMELAKFYQRPIADFFRETEESHDEDVLQAFHRVAPDFRDNPEVNNEISRCAAVCRQGIELQNLLSLGSRGGSPAYDLPVPECSIQAIRQGERVATEERRRLGLGDHPISDLADLIASQGIWASGAELPASMSGMFLHHASIGMVVLVNYEHPRARKRFSYAHEYCHAIIDRNCSAVVTRDTNRSDLVEVRANAFAAAFLMPEAGVSAFLANRDKGQASRESISVYDPSTETEGAQVEAHWRSAPRSQRITCQLVAMTAHNFGVSYQAATYRLKSLRFISKEVLDSLLLQEEKGLEFLDVLKMKDDLVGKDKKKDRRVDRELVREVVSLAVEAYARDEISKGKLLDIASLLSLPGETLVEFAEACHS